MDPPPLNTVSSRSDIFMNPGVQAMTLLDKFRPNWKHSDVEVRADAVRQLGSSARQTLTEIAKTDTEAKIRALAIKKIDDTDLLLEIHESETEEKVKEIAYERAASLLIATAAGENEEEAQKALKHLGRETSLRQVVQTAALESIRHQALERLSSGEVLSKIALEAETTETRLEAVEQLTDGDALLDLALKSSVGEVALAALAKLTSPDSIFQIAEHGAVKTVRTKAQELLDALPDDQHPTRLAKRRDEQLQLIHAVEELAKSEDWDQARDAIEEARGKWQEMGVDSGDELNDRFFAAREVFIQRHKVHLEGPTTAPTETSQQSAEKAAETTERAPEMTTKKAAETDGHESDGGDEGDEESHTPEDWAPWNALQDTVRNLSGEDIPDRIKELRKEFEALGSPPEDGAKELREGFEAVCRAAGERHEKWLALAASSSKREEICSQAEDAAKVEDLKEASQRFKALKKEWASLEGDGPAPEEFDKRFTTAAETLAARLAVGREKEAQRKKANLARVTGLAQQLENLAGTEELNLRKAERALRESQNAIRNPGPLPSRKEWSKLKKRLETAREALIPRFRQVEQEVEWKQWANVPIQEELCGRMEALIENDDLGHAARELRKLSEDWKTVASVPREKAEELWQRFRGAREKVRAKVSVYLDEQAEKRKENLKLKIALCERAEALGQSTEWKDTAEKIKAIQAEWKAIGPVPRKQSDAIWKRFRKPCDDFFNNRKVHFDAMDSERDANLKRKEALCEKAETLAESTDWEGSTNKFKALQSEWKGLGPVPRKFSDTIWKRFRKACDLFFDRRSRKDELPLEENLVEREAICADLEALLPEEGAETPSAPEGLAEKIKESRSSWQTAGDVPRNSHAAIAERFAAVSTKLMAAFPDDLQGTDLDPKATEARRNKLCDKAEALVKEIQNSQQEEEEKPSIQNLAQQLKAALAANTIRRGAEVNDGGWKKANSEFKGLQRRWQEIPGEVSTESAKRFEAAQKALAGLAPAS